MGIKAIAGLAYARFVVKKIRKDAANAIENQDKIRRELISKSKFTLFGKNHQFEKIESYDDFKQHIPVVDYEGLRPYIDRIAQGETDILWPGLPLYFAKTSGTTSGVKLIPITKESAPYHVKSAMQGTFCYLVESNSASVLDGKLLFLSGSPVLEKKNGIFIGRLSGIVNHLVPSWLKGSQVPSYETNIIEDWEEKVSKIAEETMPLDMRLISGIPAWVQMYFEKLLEKSGKKTILELFPNFGIFVYGGVNFAPYKSKIYSLIGEEIPSIETYPASEGFIAFQDTQTEEGLLLLTNHGIFYEFIPVDEYFSDNPTRVSLHDVELGVNYALILNTNAGLWGYSIGDTVKFVSKDPYRIVVSGRIKHFISAFGEHVISEEVDAAIQEACEKTGAELFEYHVAPQVQTKGELPYHEWIIEFSKMPDSLQNFRDIVDQAMCRKNIYYQDLIKGQILQKAIIKIVPHGTFIAYMKSQGKLGGQNKVPRLMNDRKLADALLSMGK